MSGDWKVDTFKTALGECGVLPRGSASQRCPSQVGFTCKVLGTQQPCSGPQARGLLPEPEHSALSPT